MQICDIQALLKNFPDALPTIPWFKTEVNYQSKTERTND